jgi:anti-sigma factor RsiW
MMDPFNHDHRSVQRYLHELRAQAEKVRLARQAAPRRPRRTLRRLRLHVAARLVAAGDVLVGRAEEQAVTMPCPHDCAGSCRSSA